MLLRRYLRTIYHWFPSVHPKTISFNWRTEIVSKYSTKIKSQTMTNHQLAVFDFDHTIVDENTDLVVRDLVSKELIPDSVRKLHKKDGWTAYMQGVFDILHLNGITESNVIKAVTQIKETPGMINLIKKLQEELNYDVIIVSDANSYFINAWLEEKDLKTNVFKVFTNPAHFSKGLLKIEMYHLQTECKLSTKNLCKGQIMEQFIADQREKGVSYDKILYAGDGSNDLCPILRLQSNDLACVREKYQCLELIHTIQQGKPLASTGKTYKLNAQLLVWNNGDEILQSILAK